MKAVKICADLFVMLSICQVATAVLQKIDNSQPPGTDADYHIEYNCANDPMGCQNMCYYYYCLGRSNYLYVPTSDLLYKLDTDIKYAVLQTLVYMH